MDREPRSTDHSREIHYARSSMQPLEDRRPDCLAGRTRIPMVDGELLVDSGETFLAECDPARQPMFAS